MLNLLNEIEMFDCKPTVVLLNHYHRLKENQDNHLIDAGRYQRLVGCLIYLSLTRPDIAYTISVVSQFKHAPTLTHIEVVYQILKYLKGYPGK